MSHSSSNPALEAVWTALGELPVVEQIWPQKRQRSYFDWRAEHDPETARRLQEEITFVRQFAIVPIVAVAGLINSGKSSVVAAFLTHSGRERVLRGVQRSQGTQRFTLWAPSTWKRDANFLGRLETMLARVFGHAPEPLAERADHAHAQQRTLECLHVPLLGFDDALDQLGIALFDCPDIQRPQPGEASGSNARLDVLRRAGQICAGVILVAPRREIEVRELENIALQLPSATRIFAVNLLRRETPHAFLQDAPAMMREKGAACYVAYDFDVTANREFAPSIDPNFESAERGENAVPFFFEARPNPPENARETVTFDRALTGIGSRLSPDSLRQRRQSELTADLREKLLHELSTLEQRLQELHDQLDEAHVDLFETLSRVMHEGKSLRIKIDPEIAAAMAESIRRTAPWDLRVFLLLKKKLVDGIVAASTGFQKAWRSLQALGGKFPFAAQKAKVERLRLDPTRMEQELRHWGARHGSTRELAAWAVDAQTIVERFRTQERTNLAPEEWDAITRAFWENTPRGRARFGIITTLLGTLGAAVWVAVEPFSGTIVLSTMVKGHVVALTVGELFGLLGLGALGVAGVGGFAAVLEREVEGKLGHQQFSNLFAIACDQLGLPRELPASRPDNYPPARIPEQRNAAAFGITERRWVRAELNRDAFEQLRARIHAL